MPRYGISLFVATLLVVCSVIDLSAQTVKSDLELLKNKSIKEQTQVHYHNVQFMRSRSSGFLVRNNPVSLAFGGMMYVYQRFISPQLPSECLYVHNCSGFSKDLIYHYGLFQGVLSTSDRLMRCNRLSALDVHPLFVDEKSGRVEEKIDVYKISGQ